MYTDLADESDVALPQDEVTEEQLIQEHPATNPGIVIDNDESRSEY